MRFNAFVVAEIDSSYPSQKAQGGRVDQRSLVLADQSEAGSRCLHMLEIPLNAEDRPVLSGRLDQKTVVVDALEFGVMFGGRLRINKYRLSGAEIDKLRK